jgi:hypothetical protein
LGAFEEPIMLATLRLLVISCACVLAWNHAQALCVGEGIQNLPRYVGNTDKASPTYDSKCTDNDIQSAINNTVCPNTPIYITGEHTYTAQALNIQGKWLSLIGSTNGCGVVPGSFSVPVITINGSTGGSVINITGNSTVTLQYLTITGGHTGSDDSGGGIQFSGTGSLTLDTATVSNNYAGYGAGINVSNLTASGVGATLTLKHNTLILDNVAQYSGGGIRIEGATRMYMLEDGSTILLNKALGIDPGSNQAKYGYGGGIEIVGDGLADIGSPGAFSIGAVSENSAPMGGGIAIFGNDYGSAEARVFSTNPTTPVLISDNHASVQGGGIYINRDIDVDAWLCAYNYRIDGNTAPDGAAIYVASDAGITSDASSSVYLNPAGTCGHDSLAALGSVACAAGTPCNEISENSALDGNENPIGAIITLNVYGSFDAERLKMLGNAGTQMITANTTSGSVTYHLGDCLIADNHSAHELIHTVASYYAAVVTNCTLANNTIDDGYVFFANGIFTLTNSIIDQPGVSSLDYVTGDNCLGDCRDVHYVLSNNVSTLPPGDGTILQGYALFVDSSNTDVNQRDYHQRAFSQDGGITASLGIDFAPSAGGLDLDGNPRDQDVPGVGNIYNPRDLGAYEERPIADRILADAFGDPVSLLLAN